MQLSKPAFVAIMHVASFVLAAVLSAIVIALFTAALLSGFVVEHPVVTVIGIVALCLLLPRMVVFTLFWCLDALEGRITRAQ